MQATEILMAEHRVIETVIECLVRMTAQAESTGKLDKQSALEAIEFIKLFADKCHHAKEENRLFPAMEAKGFPRDGGPIGVMLTEHVQGRNFVTGMVESVDAAANGDGQALSLFVRNALGYASLLRPHIMKEDQILYPMAERMMTDEDDQSLLAQYDEAESEVGEGIHERMLGVAKSLAERFGVDTKFVTAMQGGSCGHCH